MRLCKIALGLLAGSACAALAHEAALPPAVDPSFTPYASTADSVRLADGREIHFVCMGQGSPTVILTAGLGDWGAAWNGVQPGMARTTRVCAWDRPGFGLSDAGSNPQSSASTTADLEAALAAGTIREPYVLVGHSLGAYESLLYADRHRDSVVGMVLVDPTLPGQFAAMKQDAPALFAQNQAYVQSVAQLVRACAARARATASPDESSDALDCDIAYLPSYPPEVVAALKARANRTGQPEAVISFFENVERSSEQAVNPSRDYGAMPLVVLSATEPQTAPPGTSAEGIAEMRLFEAAFSRGHDALAALSTRGVNARVPGAGHYIHGTKPQVVIDAVEAVVAEARAADK